MTNAGKPNSGTTHLGKTHSDSVNPDLSFSNFLRAVQILGMEAEFGLGEGVTSLERRDNMDVVFAVLPGTFSADEVDRLFRDAALHSVQALPLAA